MECNVCLNEWSITSCIPRMLPCGHSFCSSCLQLLFKPSTRNICCPTCLSEHMVLNTNLKQIGDHFCKNFALIALADSKQSGEPLLQMKMGLQHSSKRSFSSLSSFDSNLRNTTRPRLNTSPLSLLESSISVNARNRLHSDEEIKFGSEFNTRSEKSKKDNLVSASNSDEETSEQEIPELKFDQKCITHNLLVHSYHIQRRVLLCTMCIQETGWSGEDVKIFPQAIYQIQSKIKEAQDLNKLRKIQLSSLMPQLESISSNNTNLVERKLNAHIETLREVFTLYENQMREKLKIAIHTQGQTMHLAEKKISQEFDSLQNDDLSLQALSTHDPQLLIFMTKTVDELHSKLTNFSPKLDLNNFQIAIQFRDSTNEKIKTKFAESCTIKNEQSVDSKGKEILSLDQIVNQSWVCPRCDNYQKQAEDLDYICKNCLAFKPLYYTKNILLSPGQREINMIGQRRELERNLVLQADFDGKNSANEIWFHISTKWLHNWKSFVLNQPGAGTNNSENEALGVLPPGPITNDIDLMILGSENEMIKLREGLRITVHYKAVSCKVWYLLHQTYGGGPQIARESIDIYSKPLTSAISNTFVKGQTFTYLICLRKMLGQLGSEFIFPWQQQETPRKGVIESLLRQDLDLSQFQL